ncbi:MAG: thioredoxin [Kiritimatiellae bacterium]|nr:thioredoxin [Kiritimatiellia bacterium]
MEVEITADNFADEVERAALPVLVDFWAPWCGPCQMLGPVVAEIAREREGSLKVGKVNVDEAPELAARFGVMSIPAVFLFKGGKVAAQAVGYMSKQELVARLLG